MKYVSGFSNLLAFECCFTQVVILPDLRLYKCTSSNEFDKDPRKGRF